MADIDPINTQPLSDDQELAKVLAGVSQQADDSTTSGNEATSTDTPTTPSLPQDDTPTAVPATPPVADDVTTPAAEVDESAPSVSTLPPDAATYPSSTSAPADEPTPVMPSSTVSSTPTSGSGELDSIKKEALGELRPLVDKLNVAPEEKFDTYLLLLRSTDDKALIAPAHEAARNIPDETRRAQALLDIIKEIDFLSQNGQ